MKPGEIRKGFKNLKAHVEGKEKYIADCSSCVDWDAKEGCTNPNVVAKYDLVEEGNRIYCNRWSITQRKEEW